MVITSGFLKKTLVLIILGGLFVFHYSIYFDYEKKLYYQNPASLN